MRRPRVYSVGEQPAWLIIRPRLVIIALRRRRIAAIDVILLLRLRIGLRVIDAAAAGRRRIACLVGAAVGRIDVAVIGAGLRHRLLLLRRQHPTIARGIGWVVTLGAP